MDASRAGHSWEVGKYRTQGWDRKEKEAEENEESRWMDQDVVGDQDGRERGGRVEGGDGLDEDTVDVGSPCQRCSAGKEFTISREG